MDVRFILFITETYFLYFLEVYFLEHKTAIFIELFANDFFFIGKCFQNLHSDLERFKNNKNQEFRFYNISETKQMYWGKFGDF